MREIEIDANLYVISVKHRKSAAITKVKHKQHYYEAMSHWVSMPEFDQQKIVDLVTIDLTIDSSCLPELIYILDQQITLKEVRMPTTRKTRLGECNGTRDV